MNTLSCNRIPSRFLSGTIFIVLLSGCFLAGCQSSVKTFEWKDLAKTDTDLVADTCLREMNRFMQTLQIKLYKRNPNELRKTKTATINSRVEQVFATSGRLIFDEIGQRQGTDALSLAFRPEYEGDRVFALMVGLVGMVHSSYNWQGEQFMFDSLEPQLLFDSARNLEILAWRLSNTRASQGELLLLSNSQAGEEENLSYERLFGEMIATQDMMALIVAEKMNRSINRVVQGMASVVFLPMGL